MDHDRFYDHVELSAALRNLAERFSGLVECRSIGRSLEGRDIWMMALTNRATGPDDEKPALWVSGNVHATELAASTACLYLLDTLLHAYGKDSEATRVVDTRALYVCPRINPDGAELALRAPRQLIRSSTRLYPFPADRANGLVACDVDGDGRELLMRAPDPHGAWKPLPQEPRLLVPRDPTETGGRYFRILPEGLLEGYDGFEIPNKPHAQGLDLNRNYPAAGRKEGMPSDGGPFPASEPETRAVVDFIAAHPNIISGIDFHTFSGVLLHPYSDRPDDEIPSEDLRLYHLLGRKGTELTGYPMASTFHDFRDGSKQNITGALDDWLFGERGCFAWTVEIWSPLREAGITNYDYLDWFREHSVEDDLKLLAWSDDVLARRGYVDWYPFEHPQLGRIEIGGWDRFLVFGNPPPDLLCREVARFPNWIIWHALVSPKLELHSAAAEQIGADLWKIVLVVQNTGFLPTHVSRTALDRQFARGVVGLIETMPPTRLATGSPQIVGPQLEGRSGTQSLLSLRPPESATQDRVKFEWWVQGKPGADVNLTARHDRAGVLRVTLRLERGGIRGDP